MGRNSFAQMIRNASRDELSAALQPVVEMIAKDLAGYERAQRLRAYRLRSKWRKADIAKLKALGVKGAFRMGRLSGKSQRGRGVVAQCDQIGDRISEISAIFESNTSQVERRRILHGTPWWAEFVDASYRGEFEYEHTRRASAGRRNKALRYVGMPSLNAARTVGDALHISPQSVRQMSTEARRRRVHGTPECPAMRVATFVELLRTGHLPES